MSKPKPPSYFWFRKVKALGKAKRYNRTRLLKLLAFDAGKLIAKGELIQGQAEAMLLGACRLNRLDAPIRADVVATGTSYVLKVIDRFIAKGAKYYEDQTRREALNEPE